MNPRVDFYFTKATKWQKEVEKLRTIVMDSKLTEELKWGVPCYSFEKKNIVLIHVFKDYCALLFFKGALLKDTKGILIQQTKNVQSARQMRFTSVEEIVKSERLIKAYIKEAIEVEKGGLSQRDPFGKLDFKKTKEYDIPEEFKTKLNGLPALKKSFYSLTPGRQRGYLLYFSAAKQSATRESRIKKSMKKILSGKGLDD